MEEVLKIILFDCDFAFQTSRHLASYISCPRIPSRASYRPTSMHEQSHLRAQSYPFPVYCSKQTQIPFWQLAKGLQPSHSDSSTKKKKEKNIHCFYHSCYVTLSDQARFRHFSYDEALIASTKPNGFILDKAKNLTLTSGH